MIARKLFSQLDRPRNDAVPVTTLTLPEWVATMGTATASGETVTTENSKNVATAYRCGNVISDDVAKMPFQVFQRRGPQTIERIRPDGLLRNLAWNLEISPNRWMNPFIWKKTTMLWLLYWGNAYIWTPLNSREKFLLPANLTYPGFFPDGSLWYFTTFRNGKSEYLPATEVLHLMINSVDGINGRSVITYARESIGRQLASYKTQSKFFSQGLNPAGILWMNGDLDKAGRDRVRAKFEESISGAENAGRIAIFDQKVAKFEAVSLNGKDMQFLESIQATDQDIANFFGLPLYKLNAGKQAYNSNEQQNIDYLSTTLDPYLVQWEQAAALSWLSSQEQGSIYVRFNRDVILRTDSRTRAEILAKKIGNGMLSPNEAREIEDMSAYPGGEEHYIPTNYTPVGGKNAKP